MENNEDIFDVGAPDEGAPGLDELQSLVEQAGSLQDAIEVTEDDLKRMKNELQKIRTGRIPELMASLQIDEITHKGVKVKVSEFVSGSLPKDPEKRDAAIRWLEDHEGGGLIKTNIVMAFGRSEHNSAISLYEDLQQQGFEPKIESGVHAMTLAAFVRERMANGDPIDTEVLGVYTGKVAKITTKEQ